MMTISFGPLCPNGKIGSETMVLAAYSAKQKRHVLRFLIVGNVNKGAQIS